MVASYSLNDNADYELSPGLMVNRKWPLEEKLTIVFETSGSIDIPVLSQIKRPGWTNLNTYIQRQCIFTNSTVRGNTTASRLMRRQADEDTNPTLPYEMDNSPETENISSDPFNIGTPLTKAPGIATYMLDAPYNNVGVMYIGAFASGDDFRVALLEGLNKMNSSGAEKLIIEVSGNGGGSVANGQYFEQTLFPDKFPGFPTEARAPQMAVDCARNLAQSANTSDNLYDYRQYCKVVSLAMFFKSSYLVKMQESVYPWTVMPTL